MLRCKFLSMGNMFLDVPKQEQRERSMTPLCVHTKEFSFFLYTTSYFRFHSLSHRLISSLAVSFLPAVLSSLSLHPSSLPLISSLFLYGVSCLTPTLSRSLSSGSHYLNLPTTPSIVTFPLISVTVTAATVAGPGIAVTR